MPPRTARKCIPHLPLGFIEALCEDPMMHTFPASASAVFTDAYHRRRLRIVDQTDYVINADDFVDPEPFYGEEAVSSVQRTALHHASARADPIAVCELIRQGYPQSPSRQLTPLRRLRATVDTRDSAGDTPLAVAIDEYCVMYRDARNSGGEGPSGTSSLAHCLDDWCRRQKFVITTLLEQHADVNFTRDGNTYLHQACTIGDWELIGLLLQHGATTPNRKGRRPIDLLQSEDDRAHYRELIRAYPAGQPRPPRMCPCWSGQPQSQCHKPGKPVPYPSHFYCICGSKKSYASCSCNRQNLDVLEVWDDASGVIRSLYSHTWDEERIGQIMVNKQHLIEERATAGGGRGRANRKKADEEKTKRTTVKYVEELSERGVVDPAFAYALKHTGDLPRPGKKLDPRLAAVIQLEWNGFVDDYIRSGVDPRPPFEIERSSKISLTGGALYRQCEGPNCNMWEGQDVDALRVCSRCKIATYCSSECQKSAWKDHKAICGTKNQPLVKTLSSQANLGTTVLSDLGDLVSTLKTKLQDLQGKKGKEKGKERSFAEFYE